MPKMVRIIVNRKKKFSMNIENFLILLSGHFVIMKALKKTFM